MCSQVLLAKYNVILFIFVTHQMICMLFSTYWKVVNLLLNGTITSVTKTEGNFDIGVGIWMDEAV
jgi:hypothetical protein